MSNRPLANVSFPVGLVTVTGFSQRWTISGHAESDEDGIMFTPLSATLIPATVTLAENETVEFPDSFDLMGTDPDDAWWLFAERFQCDTDDERWEGDTLLSDVVNPLAKTAYAATIPPVDPNDIDIPPPASSPKPGATFLGATDDPFGQEEPF